MENKQIKGMKEKSRGKGGKRFLPWKNFMRKRNWEKKELNENEERILNIINWVEVIDKMKKKSEEDRLRVRER